MDDLAGFGQLSRAEKELVRAVTAGEVCTLGDGTCPGTEASAEDSVPAGAGAGATDGAVDGAVDGAADGAEVDPKASTRDGKDRAIRGDLIRWLVLGGGEGARLHDSGLALRGALVTGHFDLSGASSDCDVNLLACRFQRSPRLKGAHLRSLTLDGSAVPGMMADGLRVDGTVSLARGFSASGQVSLIRARIAADLDCTTGVFDAPDGDALNCDGAEIGGSVFLMGKREEDTVTPFRCRGTARFVSCSVGDSFMAIDAVFDSAERKYGLSLALAVIRRQLTLTRFGRFIGRLNLSGASCYSLNDDPADPEAPRNLILNGFTYIHLSAKAPMDVPTRLTWLARQTPQDYGQDFWPQPYGQLAKVLRATGHEADARLVLVAKETRQARIAISLAREEGRRVDAWQTWLGDQFMRRVIGYGYRPQQGLVLMVAIWAATAVFFHQAWEQGDMAPGAAPVLISASWQAALQAEPVYTAAHWTSVPGPGQDYETFSALAYAFDLFVPLVDLGQESSWAPSTERGPLGRIGWWLRWIVEIVGWVMTALAAAAVTGLVRRD